ncbi:MAG: glycerol-3-phosphate 1-O-acyltransferase PlsY [Defluviitaleaceae bacterium]|nr:glycerol-3-phosphate 1-O-acyltransferase PlsY [Defluviitaleaceae bacterium]
MVRLVCLLIGYAFGCIQMAYIVGKTTRDIDVREHGSGNAGTTNVFRVLGRRAGIVVFVCDVLKAVAAFALCAVLFDGGGSFFAAGLSMLPGLYAGLGVLLGHNFPFFLKFKGGKGIASFLGVMLALNWQAALIVYGVGFVVLVVSKYVSLTSLVMSLLFPVLLVVFGYGIEVVGVVFVMTAMAFFLHRGNIQRLVKGNERTVRLPWEKRPPKEDK